MTFILRSLALAVMATPFMLWSKLFLEMKWNFICGVIVFVCIAGVFTTPLFLVFIPFALAAAHSATSLGSLHSMLVYVNLAKEFDTELLPEEILKTSIVRAAGYLVAIGVTGVLLLGLYGWDYLALSFQDYQGFVQVETSKIGSGQIPAFLVALISFKFLFLLMEAVFAVPMAAAAHGLGPSDRNFNGYWGIGFRWFQIYITWLFWGFVLLFLIGLVFEFLATEFELRSVFHLIGSFISGTPPDLVNYPIKEPVFSSNISRFAAAILLLASSYLPAPLWAASCAMAFREKLVLEKEEQIRLKPCPDELREKQEMKRRAAASLRSDRMPHDWKAVLEKAHTPKSRRVIR